MVAAEKRAPVSGGGPPKPPPGKPALIYVMDECVLSKVELRRKDERLDGIILSVNADDGTIDVQTENGLGPRIRKYNWITKPLADAGIGGEWFWQWPNSPEPEKE